MADFDPRTDLRGIVASLHTPFTRGDAIDEASLARLVDHCVRAGCCGVLVAAVAGEVGALRLDERQRVLAVVAEAAAGRLRIVAGSARRTSRPAGPRARGGGGRRGHGALAAAARHGRTRARDGAPHSRRGWPGAGHAAGPRLAGAGPRAGADRPARRPRAGADRGQDRDRAGRTEYSTVRRVAGGRLHLSGGWAAMQMLDGLARGLDAFIPSGMLPVYVRIFDLWSAGRHDAARALFERALPVLAFSNQHIDVSIRFWKHVRRLQGIFGDARCRPPIGELDPVQRDEAELLAARALALEAGGD